MNNGDRNNKLKIPRFIWKKSKITIERGGQN